MLGEWMSDVLTTQITMQGNGCTIFFILNYVKMYISKYHLAHNYIQVYLLISRTNLRRMLFYYILN